MEQKLRIQCVPVNPMLCKILPSKYFCTFEFKSKVMSTSMPSFNESGARLNCLKQQRLWERNFVGIARYKSIKCDFWNTASSMTFPASLGRDSECRKEQFFKLFFKRLNKLKSKLPYEFLVSSSLHVHLNVVSSFLHGVFQAFFLLILIFLLHVIT
jgi:hypothetical protein